MTIVTLVRMLVGFEFDVLLRDPYWIQDLSNFILMANIAICRMLEPFFIQNAPLSRCLTCSKIHIWVVTDMMYAFEYLDMESTFNCIFLVKFYKIAKQWQVNGLKRLCCRLSWMRWSLPCQPLETCLLSYPCSGFSLPSWEYRISEESFIHVIMRTTGWVLCHYWMAGQGTQQHNHFGQSTVCALCIRRHFQPVSLIDTHKVHPVSLTDTHKVHPVSLIETHKIHLVVESVTKPG